MSFQMPVGEHLQLLNRPRQLGFALRGGLLLVVLVGIVWFMGHTSSSLAGWSTDYDAAIEAAAEDHRLVLLNFTLPGCAPCKAMEHEVLGQGAVRAALKGFLPVHVDLMVRGDLARQFNVYAAPTFVIITADQTVVSMRQGYLTVEQFVAFLVELPGL